MGSQEIPDPRDDAWSSAINLDIAKLRPLRQVAKNEQSVQGGPTEIRQTTPGLPGLTAHTLVFPNDVAASKPDAAAIHSTDLASAVSPADCKDSSSIVVSGQNSSESQAGGAESELPPGYSLPPADSASMPGKTKCARSLLFFPAKASKSSSASTKGSVRLAKIAPKTEPEVLSSYQSYLESVKGLQLSTCDAYLSDILLLALFLKARGVDLLNASEENIAAFLEDCKKSNGDRARARKLSSLHSFYHFLFIEKYIFFNPTWNFNIPKTWVATTTTMTEEEVDIMLRPAVSPPQKQPGKALYFRNRAILELLYAIAVRGTELATLDIENLDIDSLRAMVIGKGGKDRVLPITEVAADALIMYFEEGRPILAKRRKERGIQSQNVFLSVNGLPVTRQTIYDVVKSVDSNATPHRLRHSSATHMGDHGAKLDALQEMLGHSDPNTTRIYVHLSRDSKMAAHQKYHPRGACRSVNALNQTASSQPRKNSCEPVSEMPDPEVSQ